MKTKKMLQVALVMVLVSIVGVCYSWAIADSEMTTIFLIATGLWIAGVFVWDKLLELEKKDGI
jgi:hypothetical protein